MHDERKYIPGIYTGQAQGFGGIVTATVHVNSMRILSIETDAQEETPEHAFVPRTEMTQEIVRQGHTNVDAVSGATITSDAIKEAVAGALNKAKGEQADQTMTDMKPGRYIESSKGYDSTIEVETELGAREILSVKVLSADETPGMGQAVLDKMAENIVQAQSLAVDGVSGATVTCAAIKAAVGKAIGTAGGSRGAFMKLCSKPEKLKEISLETDVVVVGSGIAGLCAAVEARQNKAEVILLEKLGIIGGTSIVARGAMMGTMTRWNKERGDESEELANWWYERQEKHENVKYEQLLYVAQNSGALIDWVSECSGIEFDLGYGGDSEKMWSHRPSGTLEKASGFSEHLHGTASMITNMSDCFLKLGGKQFTDTRAVRLICENGEVTGVVAESGNCRYTINARGGVVIAAGGYEASPELVKRFAPQCTNMLLNGYTAGDTGDGILMCEEAGAKLVFPGYLMDSWNGIEDVRKYGIDPMMMKHKVKCIEVNGRMERFYNENTSAEREKREFTLDGGGEFYIIFDSSHDQALLENFDKAAVGGAMLKSDTIEGLADAIGKNPTMLRKTVDRWNAMAESGVDSDFGNKLIAPMDSGPYYLGRIFVKCTGSFGGAAINLEANVLNTSGLPIPGLYAAGESANGEFFYRDYVCGGSSFSMGGVFGRAAGKNAAKRAKR